MLDLDGKMKTLGSDTLDDKKEDAVGEFGLRTDQVRT
jgi:hypothetical protein